MTLTVDREIWQTFPGMRIVAVRLDARAGGDRSLPRRAVEAAEIQLREGWSYPNAQSHPQVAAWREGLRRVGLSPKKFPSSIEALCRRVLAGKPLPSVNPLVDLYNAVSLRFVVPAGAWDLDTLPSSEVTLGPTRGGEGFRELGREGDETVTAGEIAYRAGATVITRHFVWRQSETGKVTADTRRALLVSEVLAACPEGTAEAVMEALVHDLEGAFGAVAEGAILDRERRAWRWEEAGP